eukprot:TRINITY_DN11122_c0_g1_i1.p1 TRINITY_DN11122_c0_g1~~TRINITY_DN11122_c0_g1_i1.p1  ORF type:complete len:419 (+),score=77.07 TRINITY_DN11122_c0_g1_i1:51-1307(+)
MGVFVLLCIVFSVCLYPTNGLTQHTGYITVDFQQKANLFYWIVESENDPVNDPVVLWVSGGPGCSGELALFYENGPWTVNEDQSLTPNPYSWSKVATVIWIDQPATTGYSYSVNPYVVNETMVAEEMRIFFQGFFKQYPQYNKQNFFISGESYGGRYVPAMAQMILNENEAPTSPSLWIPINLQGISIGNGIVDPIYQYPLQADWAWQNNLINQTGYDLAKSYGDKCKNDILVQDWDSASNDCNMVIDVILKYAGDINPMNFEDHCEIQNCFNYDNITNYLNNPATKMSIGVPQSVTWQACNFDVQFSNQDEMSSFSPVVANILSYNVSVLVYYGALDLVCPTNGGLEWMEMMNWPGKSGFNTAPLKVWNFDGSAAGLTKSYNNLVYLQVKDGGHMTPHDVPDVSLQLFSNFIFGKPF